MTTFHRDTIFALSSGLPPAGIALFRISGGEAGAVLERLTKRKPRPRQASLRTVRDPASGEMIDRGLVLWFPGPDSATGEDLAELHLHGGRAVVAVLLRLLSEQPNCREAKPGEFARRAFEHGRIDLAQAEGLADLIEAETELQRRAALNLAEGSLGTLAESWRRRLLVASALVEAELDFADEGDVPPQADVRPLLDDLIRELSGWLARPSAERLKDGIKVVIAGPPNAGKSSLINALAGKDVALIADTPGTTRDRIETTIAIAGVPITLIDTAGLRASEDAIEAMGVELSERAIAEGDIILWLGDADLKPDGATLILSKADVQVGEGMPVSAKAGTGLGELRSKLVAMARLLLPSPGSLALNARHRQLLGQMKGEIEQASRHSDPLLVAEHLRLATSALDRLTGGASTEDMLTTLFSRLCIGK